MSESSPAFPDGWPENCPPLDAVDADAMVFRTVASDPPSEKDFLSFVEEGKKITQPQKICVAHGISVMRTLEDARHHREFLRWKKGHIAQGKLIPAHGKLKSTHSGRFPSHLTWWCYRDVVRHEAFEVVEE